MIKINKRGRGWPIFKKMFAEKVGIIQALEAPSSNDIQTHADNTRGTQVVSHPRTVQAQFLGNYYLSKPIKNLLNYTKFLTLKPRSQACQSHERFTMWLQGFLKVTCCF